MPAEETIFLVPVDGPTLDAVRLDARPAGYRIGREPTMVDVALPDTTHVTSRVHARIEHSADAWRVIDQSSTWGTFLNGVRLHPDEPVPMRVGDYLRIAPWTFVISPTDSPRGQRGTDDLGTTHVTLLDEQTMPHDDAGSLQSLLAFAQQLSTVTSERTLAELLADAALGASGLTTALVLKRIGSGGEMEVIARRSEGQIENTGRVEFSQSLVAAATTSGQPAVLDDLSDVSQSIVRLGLQSAMCVPLTLGGAGEAAVPMVLYIDGRGARSRKLGPRAQAECAAVGRIASIMLSSLRRSEVEKRLDDIRRQLEVAAAVQRTVMPPRTVSISNITCTGESRPGQQLGGDFFDVIRLPGGRVAVTIGDVTGKGVVASVLMTVATGFLHAALVQHGNPARAMTALDGYLRDRRPADKFITAWAGVIDPIAGTLTYCDAGHGHVFGIAADGSCQRLAERGGIFLGLTLADYECATIPLSSLRSFVLTTDGIIEQFARTGRAMFGAGGVEQVISKTPATDDLVAALFAAVTAFAEKSTLDDDATVVHVRWS